MAKVDVYNWDKKKVSTLDLGDDIFGQEVNSSLLHRVVVWQLARRRQGTHSTKTRSEVRGGGKKPFRQKGTGNARQGTKRSPLMSGGAILFGPKPRNYSYSLPKKLKKLALKMALSQLVKDSRLFILDDMKLSSAKTKDLNEKITKNFGMSKVILVPETSSESLERSSKNLKKVICSSVNALNVYDLLKYENLILEKGSVANLVELFNGRST